MLEQRHDAAALAPAAIEIESIALESTYVIGIDLGTTNSALAFAEIGANADPFAPANVRVMAIPQLANPGEVRDEDLLPSFLYLAGPSHFPAGSLALPWDPDRTYVVGQPGTETRRGECRAAGVLGQELAIALGCGPRFAAGAVSRSRRRR